MNTFILGVRNAFRNVVRTVSIIIILGLSIGLSLVMLIAHQAVAQKIATVKSAIGNTITISPAGFSQFSQANNSLSSSDLAKVSAISHVEGVSESLTDRITTIGSSTPSGRFGNDSGSNTTSLVSPVTINTSSNGGGRRFFISGGGSLPTNFSLPISIIGTNNPSQINGTAITFHSGSKIDGSKDTNTAEVSTTIASKNNLVIGSTFQAYGTTLTVGSIFDSGSQGGNNTVIVSLPALQRLSGQAGAITGGIATVDSLDNLNSVTSSIKNVLGSNADVESAQTQADNTIAPLQNIANVSLVSLIGAIVASSIIILLTMIMIVRERRREIGILKAIGASNLRVVLQFMSESVTLTIIGALLGVGFGTVAASPITNALVTSSVSSASSQTASQPGGGGFGGFRRSLGGLNAVGSNIRAVHATVGWTILLDGLIVAIVIAVVGSSLAGWMIARVRPAEVMRAE